MAATLGAAAVSRRRLQQNRAPRRSVRGEGGLTVGVLVVTALLSMTTPPPQGPAATTLVAAAGATGSGGGANGVVDMPLGDRGRAVLAVLPATTAGSELHVVLTDATGQRLRASRVDLAVSSSERGLGRIPVPLSRKNGVWVADYRFPLPGVWTATVTVADRGEPAVVTAGDVTISD